MKPYIHIASGQGFWGDLLTAPINQVKYGNIDYLVMDYLAEVTMSILQKQKLKNPKLGFATDLIPLIEEILPICIEKNIKIITNGGGVNPIACKDAIISVANKLGFNVKIGVVRGDDILEKIDFFLSNNIDLKNMETNKSCASVKEKILSSNVYFGAAPIVEALKLGAQIIITGRTTDTGITLAPMIYEFDWSLNDWNKLASGTIAGHILECGAQSSGGNFSYDWESVPNMENIGFPIAEAYPNGEIIITKHKELGGQVSLQTIKEQLLYEIGDPKNYITPDCIADFTTIDLEEIGENKVKIKNVKGKPSTEFYKVSMTYLDGYTAFSTLTYCWPNALKKAKKADEILRKRFQNLKLEFEEIRTEFLGYNSCHYNLSEDVEPNEIVMRIGVRSKDFKSVERFGKEIAPLILTGPPGVTGFAGGRPKPSEVIAYWPSLILKNIIQPIVEIF